MDGGSPGEGFRVTDRRRRGDEDPGSGAASPTASADSAPPSASPLLDPGRSLSGLFVMLAGSALAALGESPDPLTGLVHQDLAQASEAIDILALLRDKTAGNRTPEEDELLEHLVYDLQMRFVRATRAAPPSAQPGAPPRP